MAKNSKSGKRGGIICRENEKPYEKGSSKPKK